jgi:hypothetical protein
MREKTFSEMKDTSVDNRGVSVANAFYDMIREQDREIGRIDAQTRRARLLGYAPANISPADAAFRRTAAKQCEICEYVFKNEQDKNLDHNHVTGQFRGFLCCPCNTALGYFEKFIADSELSNAMLAFIEKNGGVDAPQI